MLCALIQIRFQSSTADKMNASAFVMAPDEKLEGAAWRCGSSRGGTALHNAALHRMKVMRKEWGKGGGGFHLLQDAYKVCFQQGRWPERTFTKE